MTGGVAPLVAVTGRRRSAAGAHDGPPALDALAVEVYFAGYADRLAAAGAVPVHLASRADPVSAIGRVDALVLSGGTDVAPQLYGDVVRSTTPALDPVRDGFETALLRAALARDLPVLAICRGMQLLNVVLGGTLHPHLEGHPAGRGEVHPVEFAPGCVLRELYGPSVSTNSLHHQSIDVVGAGLMVGGLAPDGVVEAVEMPDRAVIGVQWHPEQLARTEPVFAWLVEAARTRIAARVGDAV